MRVIECLFPEYVGKIRKILPFRVPILSPGDKTSTTRGERCRYAHRLNDGRWMLTTRDTIDCLLTRLKTVERRAIFQYLADVPWTVVYEPLAGEYPRERVWNLSGLAEYKSLDDVCKFGRLRCWGGFEKTPGWFSHYRRVEYIYDPDTDTRPPHIVEWHTDGESGVLRRLVEAGYSFDDAKRAMADIQSRPVFAERSDYDIVFIDNPTEHTAAA